MPVRERRTQRRVPKERVPYRSGKSKDARTWGTARPTAWDADENDYVEINVDPLDPFTATSHTRSTRSLWDEEEVGQEDWVPIFGLMGIAAIIWLCSVIGNTLPASAPSLGM